MPDRGFPLFDATDRPLLIGLGPIRSGTTWVHELLYGHSQVATTRRKEVNFFNDRFEAGLGWYRAQFKPVTAATRLMADISPFYLMDPEVCERIRRSVTNPILLINLRSPYDRLLSWYQRYRQTAHPIGCLASDAAVRAEALSIGLMAANLRCYLDRFGRDRIILVDYEALKRDPATLAARLQHRLGLDVEMPPSVHRAVNASVRYRNAPIRRLAHLGGPIIRKMSPTLFYAMKFGPLYDFVFTARRLDGPSIDEKRSALASLYEPLEADISRLEVVLDCDLSHWRFEAQVVGWAAASAAGRTSQSQGLSQPSPATVPALGRYSQPIQPS